ncbi:MAG: transglutaminase family protein [Desulfuromonas sp.]|nr:transglutaminase family protein [Desulfuromonas sp.]
MAIIWLVNKGIVMWLNAACFLDFNITVPTPFLLMLRPRSGGQQWIAREEYVLSPSVAALEFTDTFGNLCQRLVAPAGYFSVRTSVDIETADSTETAYGAPFVEVQNLPNETLPFLYPSRYCESDRFTTMAATIAQDHYAGYDQCQAIVDYIRQSISYTPGLGQQIISATELLSLGNGVCRDMAHLGIACCRALSIPARMVVGYLEGLEPMDLHAWFEAYVGNRWYTFDPTQANLQGGRVAIAFGRDAADVAIYTQFGDPVELLNMNISVKRMAGPPY